MEQSVPSQARSVGDPALLQRVAWSMRWQSRAQSLEYAGRALELLKGDTSAPATIRRGQVLVTLAWQAKWRGDFDAAMTHALRAEGLLSEQTHPVVLVTNEVGSGIVPDNALSRRFRDAAGRLNQDVAAVADEVYLSVSGCPVRIKPGDTI